MNDKVHIMTRNFLVRHLLFYALIIILIAFTPNLEEYSSEIYIKYSSKNFCIPHYYFFVFQNINTYEIQTNELSEIDFCYPDSCFCKRPVVLRDDFFLVQNHL